MKAASCKRRCILSMGGKISSPSCSAPQTSGSSSACGSPSGRMVGKSAAPPRRLANASIKPRAPRRLGRSTSASESANGSFFLTSSLTMALANTSRNAADAGAARKRGVEPPNNGSGSPNGNSVMGSARPPPRVLQLRRASADRRHASNSRQAARHGAVPSARACATDAPSRTAQAARYR